MGEFLEPGELRIVGKNDFRQPAAHDLPVGGEHPRSKADTDRGGHGGLGQNLVAHQRVGVDAAKAVSLDHLGCSGFAAAQSAGKSQDHHASKMSNF